ncbi:kinase-like domain, phloem protein 2-like protein [Tanacetum coccineum]
MKSASQTLFYESIEELKMLLSIGVHLNGFNTWFSLNENGENCEMISIADCLLPNENYTCQYEPRYYSRFPGGIYQTNKKGFKTHVTTQFLSPFIKYTVNLVLMDIYSNLKQKYVNLKYKLQGETRTSTVYLANRRLDDSYYVAELYQFTSDGRIIDLEISSHYRRHPGFSPIVTKFQELAVIKTNSYVFEIVKEIKSDEVSPDTTYAIYLVYRLPENPSTLESPLECVDCKAYLYDHWYIYLAGPPDTPTIGQKIDQNTHNPLNRPKLNSVPQQRSDGWMEVKVCPFKAERMSMHLKVQHCERKDLGGLIIQGVELRPI